MLKALLCFKSKTEKDLNTELLVLGTIMHAKT